MENTIITNAEEKATITTLEIAEMMGVDHWQILRKIDGMSKNGEHIKGYLEILTDNNIVVSDYLIPFSYKDASGKENKCYKVTKMGCDFLANKFTGEKGVIFTAKYVKRFAEMEQELKPRVPTTYKEALLETIRLLEENEKLEKENNELKPKAEFFDTVADSKTAISMNEVAKVLNIKGYGRNNLFEYLRNNGILDKYNVPYQRYVDCGYFRVIEQKYMRNGEPQVTTKTLVYQKGIDAIRKMIAKKDEN